MSEEFKVKISLSSKGLSAVRPAWLALLAVQRDYAFYQHPLWFESLNSHLLQNPLLIAQLWRGDRLVLIAPLMMGKGGLSNPRHDHIALSDWLIDPTLGVDELMAHLPRLLGYVGDGRWSRLELHDFARARELHESLHQATDTVPALMSTWRAGRNSAWFDCRGPDSPVPGKLKRNLRRLRKKSAHVRVTRATSPEALSAAFETFLRIEASGWKGEEDTAIQGDAHLRGFYHQLISDPQPGIAAEINLLELDGQVVAGQLGLRTPGLLSLLKIGFDEAFAAASPGSLLLDEVLQQAVDDPATERVSLVTDPLWAERWHPERTAMGSVSLYNNTTSGHAFLGVDRFRATAAGFCRGLIKRPQSS